MTPTQEKQPALYNPAVCVLLAILFTPMYGAFLQGLNWRALGDDEKAARSMRWVEYTFYAFALFTFCEPFLSSLPFSRFYLAVMLLVFWAGWALALGLDQVRFVKRLCGNYERLFFGRSIMLGAFGWATYSAVAVTFALLLHVTGLMPFAPDAP